MLFSDGGPDHQVTFHSVQMSLISIFKEKILDMLIATRTTTGHSWANPAECVISLLNLAYQNNVILRDFCGSEFEQQLKKCSGMEDIRKISRDNFQYQQEWSKLLRSMIKQLEERTKQVVLKNNKFIIGKPASNDEVQNEELSMIQNIDKLIMKGIYQKQDMKNCKDLQAFLTNHCRL